MLQQEMARVDNLRMHLDMHHPENLFREFWMRRAYLRARFALMQRNMDDARRMLTVLSRITRDGN